MVKEEHFAIIHFPFQYHPEFELISIL